MYDRILVPVDGSAFSEEILAYATGIAKAGGAELSLLRVVSRVEDRADAQRDIEALAAEVSAQESTVIVGGEPDEVILGVAQRKPGTLIAMSSQGRSGLMEAMLGSVAKSVVRATSEPVLIYRPRGAAAKDRRQPIGIKTVLLSLDGTPASEVMAPQAAAMAKALGANLEVVQVILPGAQPDHNIPASDIRESSYVKVRSEDYHTRYGVRTSWEVLHGEPVSALTRHVGSRRDVLLAMATRGQRPLETAILGSVTGGCLRESGVPILTRKP
ncbi:MAG: universal stress protein [Burkholderiaceae bacterium]